MIYLIGFMGSGKTTIGQALANELKLNFFDTDKLIAEKEKKSINAIFENAGELHFRDLEKVILEEINTKSIIACGGGLPIYNDNLKLINNKGVSIYLKASTSTLLSRLRNEKNTRPLISKLTDNQLKEYINSNLKKRETIYKKAKHTILIDKKSIDEIVQEIKSLNIAL